MEQRWTKLNLNVCSGELKHLCTNMEDLCLYICYVIDHMKSLVHFLYNKHTLLKITTLLKIQSTNHS